ncbi:AraC family transcriptional regulator [Mycobacterium sp. IS-1496]|uniref:AraC family transcriptional regulator n=1 Tax=Mycobacterium sp. IS-1496 TaxID=1772284 RepID=UPI00074177DA|nr:AraC family transcriptional regulator [Mycobacterium sp. IS-1496]KUI26003.1 AraC family transcriptional regulator [Mycobacterium sp. IS-1496]
MRWRWLLLPNSLSGVNPDDGLGPVETLVSLLRPTTVESKIISGAGEWSVREARYADPAFCVMLRGSCVLRLDGHGPIELHAGDFMFLTDMPGFVMASGHGVIPTEAVVRPVTGEARHGDRDGPAAMRMLGGYFRFEPENAPLLAPLLPRIVLVRHDEARASRLRRIVELIGEETDTAAPCDLILVRLVEVLLVEAMRLRAAPVDGVERGLIAGLGDPLLAPALRALHADLAYGWTVERLARAAGASRAVFAERFSRTMGMPPMQYLAQWRMAVAKDMLRNEDVSMAEVARRTGYLSASAFTTAFTRMTGSSPSAFARASG